MVLTQSKEIPFHDRVSALLQPCVIISATTNKIAPSLQSYQSKHHEYDSATEGRFEHVN